MENFRKGLSESELVLFDKVVRTVNWLEKASKSEITCSIRDNWGYDKKKYGSIFVVDLTIFSERNNMIKFRDMLRSCDSKEARDRLIINLFQYELGVINAKRTNNIDKRNLKNAFEFSYSEYPETSWPKNSPFLSSHDNDDFFEQYITAVDKVSEAEYKFINYVKMSVLTRVGDFLSTVLVLQFPFFGITLQPGMVDNYILTLIIAMSSCLAFCFLLNFASYSFEWLGYLKMSNKVVDLFKKLGIYEELVKYLDSSAKVDNLRKKSILGHQKTLVKIVKKNSAN